ncbi:MAG: thermonuclease family protein [Phormidesmis sp.]
MEVRLCGIDAPEKTQALGIESRDHLRRLIAQGEGRITLVEIDTDRYGYRVAEAFVQTGDGEEEIYLNGQMVADGMAYVFPQFIGSCSNGTSITAAERAAESSSVGLWADPKL